MFNAPMYFIGGGTPTSGPRGAQCRLTDLLECFFIAHPNSGRKEGEESKRVMYFFPKSESIDKQADISGFAEAVVNFTDNFVNTSTAERARTSSEVSYRDVVTSKTVHAYAMLEKAEFMFGIILNKKACVDMDYTIFSPTLRSILIDSYKMFRLLFGKMTHFLKDDVDKFKDRLDYFFSRYLSLQRVYQMPLLDNLRGVQFLRLEPTMQSGPLLMLDIDALVNELLEEFPRVTKIVFLYQDRLLYYTVNKRDLSTLVRYLSQNLLPMSLRNELEPNTMHTRSTGSQSGKFLTGPLELTTDEPITGEEALPTMHLSGNDQDELTPFHLMAYRCLNATVCLFVKDEVDRHLMRDVAGFLDTQLPHLASQIAESLTSEERLSIERRDRSSTEIRYNKQPGDSRGDDFHYIYFNPSSLSLQSSFLDQSSTIPVITGGPPTVPPAVHKLACDAYSRLLEDGEEFGECAVKAEGDWWVYVKKAAQRVLIILLPPSGLTSLTDLHSRVQIILKTYFQSIFLLGETK